MKSHNIGTGAIAGLFLLAGCTGQELHDAQLIEPQGSEFNQSLYHGYIGLSEAEYAEGDYYDSDVFAKRATMVGTNGNVSPEMIEERGLPGDHVAELSDARSRLVAALDAGAAAANPKRAADAQVYFDCWMQEQEENWQPEDISRCRDNFYAALDGIEPAPAPAPVPVVSKPKPQSVRFVVYFLTNQYDIDSDDDKVIAEAKSAAQKLGSPMVKISGNTDTVGSKEYNQKLSEMRAQAVAKVLESGNIPVRAMVTEAHGELNPATVTGDEIDEQRNRRVEIILEP
jgi:outer membrane protein OmpA-like peptidoglycan-associated protein